MASKRAEITIKKAADDVWAVVGDFGGLASWAPGIETCTVEGDERTVATMGMEIVERLLRHDDAARVITYGIVGGAVPVQSHEATITVTPQGDDSSHVTYDVETDEAMVEMMSGMYASSLEALKAKLEG